MEKLIQRFHALLAATKAYIVKDDIEYGFGNTIPLWHFGFLY